MDARRSVAAGDLARTQLALDLAPGETPSVGRAVSIVVHLRDGIAALDHPGVAGAATLLPLTRLRAWCDEAGTRVTVKPVIDLAEQHTTDAYRPTTAIAERVRATWATCVFPFCGRPSRGCDLDHRVPYPHGPTSTTNLAPLCRRHHRAKTHHRWRYRPSATNQHGVPTGFTWTSPTDDTYVVDRSGTTAL